MYKRVFQRTSVSEFFFSGWAPEIYRSTSPLYLVESAFIQLSCHVSHHLHIRKAKEAHGNPHGALVNTM